MSKPVNNTQYVIPIGNAWMVKAANRAKFSLIAVRKSEAITFARAIAKNIKPDLVIYGKKGQILTKISYKSMAKTKRARSTRRDRAKI
jgi:Uncharacterized protein conserved in bacteria (DUF2188)